MYSLRASLARASSPLLHLLAMVATPDLATSVEKGGKTFRARSKMMWTVNLMGSSDSQAAKVSFSGSESARRASTPPSCSPEESVSPVRAGGR